MKLSVIVPVHNREKSIKNCIDSLLSAVVEDMEIIALNNCSEDSSLALLKEYEAKNPELVKVIDIPEYRGEGGAKNLGIRKASGEWLSFINPEDSVSKDFYEKLLNKADETNADIVGCGFTDETGGEYTIDATEFTGEMDGDKHAYGLIASGKMETKIYKKSIFTENGLWFPDNMNCDETVPGALAFLYCTRYEYVDEANYIKGETGKEAIDLKSYEDRLDVATYLTDECYKRDFLEEYPDEIEYKFTEIFYLKTLFSYMENVSFFKRKIGFLKELKEGMEAYYPDFFDNPYYLENVDERIQRLAEKNARSPFAFNLYYTFKSVFGNKDSLKCDIDGDF